MSVDPNHPVAVLVRKILERRGVRVIVASDGSMLFDAPAKWMGVIVDLSACLVELHDGRPLPDLKSKKRGG